jgi:serine/threonine protein kinase
MIRELERKGYKKNAPHKYHIDYDDYEKHTDNLLNFVRNKKDIHLLETILLESNKYGPIVVKIGQENKTIEKEFDYGKQLENAKIPGFIRFFEKPKEEVILMPYISEGSLRTFDWTPETFIILESVILQTMMSSMLAYITCGFIHGDFHLDNILLQKTEKREIHYPWTNSDEGFISIPTNGYQIMILDFDSSWMTEDREIGLQMYWVNLQNMFSRINTDLRTKTGDIIQMKHHCKWLQWIETNIKRKGKVENTIKILNKKMDFEWIISPKNEKKVS